MNILKSNFYITFAEPAYFESLHVPWYINVYTIDDWTITSSGTTWLSHTITHHSKFIIHLFQLVLTQTPTKTGQLSRFFKRKCEYCFPLWIISIAFLSFPSNKCWMFNGLRHTFLPTSSAPLLATKVVKMQVKVVRSSAFKFFFRKHPSATFQCIWSKPSKRSSFCCFTKKSQRVVY